MPEPEAAASPEVARGVCYALFAYEVGLSIDLDACQRRVTELTERATLRHKRRAPRYFEYRPAPLRVIQEGEPIAVGGLRTAGSVDLLLFDFGAVSVTYTVPFSGPLGDVRPSWRWLGLAGLIGGAPVFLGSIVGYKVSSQPLELAFYALAGGAILYVIGEVWQGMRRYGHRELGLILLGAGFLAAVATDMLVAYGGG